MKTPTVLVLTVATIAAAGCASPTVVNETEVGDDRLSCAQLEQEMKVAQRYEEAARDERGVTGTNVAAALLFWPGLIATAANTDEAIDAAQERQDHLRELYRARNC